MNKHKVFIIVLVVLTVLLVSFSFYAYQMVMSPNIQVDQGQ